MRPDDAVARLAVADITNLRRVRKAKAHAKAAENRIKFGQPQAEQAASEDEAPLA